MSVNSVTSQSNSLSLINSYRVAEVKSDSVFSTNGVIDETPNLKLTQSQREAVWKEISNKYDVRKATFEEVTEISRKLYEAGEITGLEHAIITFDFERATNSLKQYAPGYVPNSFTMYQTAANSNGERDWIAEFEARASKDFQYGQLAAYQTKSKILSVLRKLDS